jgi:hypothetical protein
LFTSLGLNEASSVFLSPSTNFQTVQIGPGDTTTITLNDLTPQDAFGVIQANSYLQNVTISYNQTLQRGFYATGINVGLVVFVSGPMSAASVYLTNSNPSPTQVFLGLQVYDTNGMYVFNI